LSIDRAIGQVVAVQPVVLGIVAPSRPRRVRRRLRAAWSDRLISRRPMPSSCPG